MSNPERDEVELPLCQHLESLGWTWTEDPGTTPATTFRHEFSDVYLAGDLARALTDFNPLDNGNPWVGDAQVREVMTFLSRPDGHGLLERNRNVTQGLIAGVTVTGLADVHQGRGQTLRLFDWDNPGRNTFRVINQLKVKLPPGRTSDHILPDVVLFVNGLPLVVIEAKAPSYQSEKIPEAIDQLERYSNQRNSSGQDEGIEALFHTNQFLVATDRDTALYGPLGTDGMFWHQWKETFPEARADVEARRGHTPLNSLEVLTEGLLVPANLLAILRSYILFSEEKGALRKVVPRYQQFPAVENAVVRLKTGNLRKTDPQGEDRRGGIIWHTQGSGKSLTMTFLVRRVRNDETLRRLKVVLVTDRRDLQTQLKESLAGAGQNLYTPDSIKALQARLRVEGPEVVFATIQKYQDTLWGEDEVAEHPGNPYLDAGALNSSENILVLVDEGHRSQAGDFHVNLLAALPNCARIAFTGTPILMGKKKKTEAIFGDYIDKYRLKDAEDDEAIVPIVYEGRNVQAMVKDQGKLEDLFAAFFSGAEKADDLKALAIERYGRKGEVLESSELIEAKALDMLRHYLIAVLPHGLKAQVVAYSRRAAVRYLTAFQKAKLKVLGEMDGLYRSFLSLPEDEITDKPADIQACYYGHRHRATLEALEFAVVISGTHNDPQEYSPWTGQEAMDNHIARFKKPFKTDSPAKGDDLGFLIVKNMLLTGFDAPIEGVLYLDRPVKEAELLQTIARVNRTYAHKTQGLVVDYFGLSHHLTEALKAYSQDEVEGVLSPVLAKLPLLAQQHRAVLGFFERAGFHGLEDPEACKTYLTEGPQAEKHLADLWVLAQKFLTTLDLLIPRPETKPYLPDARTLAEILAKARQSLQTDRPILTKSMGEKIRTLLDNHLLSRGIDIKIPPVPISDPKFRERVNASGSPKSQAQDMEHALRRFLREMGATDQAGAAKFSERLDQLIKELDENWNALFAEMQKLYDEASGQEREKDLGLAPEEIPVLHFLEAELSARSQDEVLAFVQHLASVVRKKSTIVGFWSNRALQDDLEHELFQALDDSGYFAFDALASKARELVELARSNKEQWSR